MSRGGVLGKDRENRRAAFEHQLDAIKMYFFIVHAIIDQQTFVTYGFIANDAGPGLRWAILRFGKQTSAQSTVSTRRYDLHNHNFAFTVEWLALII